jgi:hypothetical protein
MRWEWQGINFKYVLLALAAGLVLLLGGHWGYQTYGYNQPLIQALEEDEAVVSYVIDDSLPVLRVEVQLKRTVNLMETYQALDRRVAQSLPGRSYQLVVKDNRDARLSEAYYRSQFVIHQAIMQGNFAEMAAVVEENARAAGAEARVFIDSDYVYVHMEGVDHQLMAVIPRQSYAEQRPSGNGSGSYVQRG